jgi:Zn-finger nucleic acid-binding protein
MKRICHACKQQLKTELMQGQQVDRCPQCEGIFFDKGELGSIVHLIKLYQGLHLEEEDIDSVPVAEHRRIVFCPQDQSEMVPKDIMGLTIDHCPECEGIWLDSGEIATLKMSENHIRQNLNLYIRLGE